MVLIPQKPSDIKSLIDKCDELSVILKDLRANMLHPGPEIVELDVAKADNFLNHLIDWATRAKKKHRNIQLKEDALAKRTQIEARRKAIKKKKS